MGHRQMERGTNRFMKLFNKKSSRNDNSARRQEGTKSRIVGGSLKAIVRINTPPGSPRLRQTRSHDSLLSSQVNLNQDKTAINYALSKSNEEHCTQLTSTHASTIYFCCKNPDENNSCVINSKKARDPKSNCLTRIDKSFSIFIMEAKGVTIKKRYFCDLLLDGSHYARTSSKPSNDLCFWGEHFQFQYLPPVDTICINLYREEDKKKMKSTLIGSVHIHAICVTSQSYIEKWYPLEFQDNKHQPKNSISIRIKCKFQQIEIFPMELYTDLLQHIKENYATLCPILEPVISVKIKEDIATCMVNILQKEGLAKKFISDLLMLEFKKNDDANLLLRGNSLASKAMEAFMKLVAETYLQDTLGQAIRNVIELNIDCEVDPKRIYQMSLIQHQQRNLLSLVKTVWSHILKSHAYFPLELRKCFQLCSDNMSNSGKTYLTEKVISSSIFLRFLCPAVLSPSLFNIIHEYPDERASRNLTLIAKTLLTLANFTKFQDKEPYMEFMNEFIEAEQENMKTFLKQISSPLANNYNHRELCFDDNIDLEKQLSILETLLKETIYNDPKLYNKSRITVDLLNILQVLDHRKNQDNNNYLISEITSQSPPISFNSIDMEGSLEYISDIDVEARNRNNLRLDDKPAYADVVGKATKSNESIKRNLPFITVHPSIPHGELTLNSKDSLNSIKSSISPSKAYLTGSRKPADNLDTTDDYVLLSALGKEETAYQLPLGQSSSFSHLPTTPIQSRSISIMSGNTNHHHHFQNHLSRYRAKRKSLNEYLQYSKYNNILKTLEERRNISTSKDIFNTKDSYENSMTKQRLIIDNSFNKLGTEIEKPIHIHRGVSNNRMIIDKKVNNNMSAIPLSVQNTLYEFKPKNTNYFHNAITPINLAHSVETLHISPKNDNFSSRSSSLKQLELSDSRKLNGSTKHIPRTNPHCSPQNRMDLSVSRPKNHQYFSGIDHNHIPCLKTEVSSTKRIEKCQEEIQFLKSELDKMHQKLASAEERMFQVNISVTPKPFLEDQPLGRIYDRCQSPLQLKETSFFQN